MLMRQLSILPTAVEANQTRRCIPAMEIAMNEKIREALESIRVSGKMLGGCNLDDQVRAIEEEFERLEPLISVYPTPRVDVETTKLNNQNNLVNLNTLATAASVATHHATVITDMAADPMMDVSWDDVPDAENAAVSAAYKLAKAAENAAHDLLWSRGLMAMAKAAGGVAEDLLRLAHRVSSQAHCQPAEDPVSQAAEDFFEVFQLCRSLWDNRAENPACAAVADCVSECMVSRWRARSAMSLSDNSEFEAISEMAEQAHVAFIEAVKGFNRLT